MFRRNPQSFENSVVIISIITQGEFILIVNEQEQHYQPDDWCHVSAQAVYTARFEQETSEIEFWFEVD